MKTTKRNRFIPATLSPVLVILLFGTAALAGERPASRPNFVFILTDDQGYGDLGRHDHPLLRTPNLDRLYDESVRFDRFYVSPACSPTRAALLTGAHEFRRGVTHTVPPRDRLDREVVTLPQLLQQVGYATGIFGKWHLGDGVGYRPHERGFDVAVHVVGGGGAHWSPTLTRSGQRDTRATEGFREDVLFNEAMTFIGENKRRPFFCYIATHSPHTPLTAPESFVEPYRGRVSEEEALYLGMVANIDWNVGRLMNFLQKEGLENQTVVIFMSDNGATVGVNMDNAGMRGVKTTVWEGGHRALSLWRWPGVWRPHSDDHLTAHLDFLPTICYLAGVKIPPPVSASLEGFSLRPLLETQDTQAWPADRLLFQHGGRWPSGMAAVHKYAGAAVLQGNYLLVRSHACSDPDCEKYTGSCESARRVRAGATKWVYTPDTAQFHWGATPDDRWSLFDLRADPECRKDLADERGELVVALASAYDKWWDEMYPQMVAAGGDAGEPWPRGQSLQELLTKKREAAQATD
jgi:arylsulfatase A-like enzyme